jgi:hypothetical protein
LRIQSLETTLALYKSDALVATKAATSEMRRVKADHSAAMKRSQTKHDAAMKCLQADHSAAMKCLQTDHNAAMKRLQTEHIAATKSAAADRATKLTKERGAAEQRLAELAESKASATALPLLAALRDQLAAAQAEAREWRAQATSLLPVLARAVAPATAPACAEAPAGQFAGACEWTNCVNWQTSCAANLDFVRARRQR